MATWDGYNTTLHANRLQKTFVIDYIDLSGRLCVRQDTSMNKLRENLLKNLNCKM